MNDVDENFHQQILFEDDNKNMKSVVLDELDNAIVFDNGDYQEQTLVESINDNDVQDPTKTSWLWRSIYLLITVLVIYETTDFLITGFASSPIITSIYTLLIACLSLVGLSVLIKELTGLRLLKRQSTSRQKAVDILAGQEGFNAGELCQNIDQQLSYDISQSTQCRWQESLAENHNDQELIKLYDLTVLTKVDDKAIADIAKFSSEAMVLVAISPLAIVDMLIILWRNIKMIEKIAGLYGLKLGYWSRIKLLKQVFTNMVFVGASEVVMDLGTEALGADLLGKFSGRMAQGFGAGMLTARLGINTIKACRPLPFTQQTPRLSHVRKSLVVQVKKLLRGQPITH
jgi:putative membrane protein